MDTTAKCAAQSKSLHLSLFGADELFVYICNRIREQLYFEIRDVHF